MVKVKVRVKVTIINLLELRVKLGLAYLDLSNPDLKLYPNSFPIIENYNNIMIV